MQRVTFDQLYVCPAKQFHASIDGMVKDTLEEFPDMDADEARDMTLYSMLALLVPAGRC